MSLRSLSPATWGFIILALGLMFSGWFTHLHGEVELALLQFLVLGAGTGVYWVGKSGVLKKRR